MTASGRGDPSQRNGFTPGKMSGMATYGSLGFGYEQNPVGPRAFLWRNDGLVNYCYFGAPERKGSRRNEALAFSPSTVWMQECNSELSHLSEG